MALIGIYLFVNSKEGEGRKSKVFDLFIRIHMQLLTLSATKQEAQNQWSSENQENGTYRRTLPTGPLRTKICEGWKLGIIFGYF